MIVKERESASRKLGKEDARALLVSVSKVVVTRGRSEPRVYALKSADADEVVAAMLGRTGNLRAPCARIGKTLVVGFNEAAYASALRL